MQVSPFIQSYQGPTDSALRSNAVEGYTQVSRIGESVVNAFVDPYEFGVLPGSISQGELTGAVYKDKDGSYKKVEDGTGGADLVGTAIVEQRPHFYEWATAYVGMIAVQRKQRSNYRPQVAAETAAPVIVCAAGRTPVDEYDFQFAGVVRSNSVRTVDDGVGPKEDEFFTLTIAGPQTILNNSSDIIHPGDQLSWTFYSESKNAERARAKNGSPRRIGIKVSDYTDESRFGRALTFAKPGQMLDVLVQL